VRNRIEKNSGGRIKFDFLGGTEVIPSFEQGEAVKSGVVDAAFVPSGYLKGMVPEGLALTNTPINSPERRAIGFYDLLNEIYQKHNLYYVMNCDASGYPEHFHIFLNTVIDKPEDIKGMKLRASGTYRPTLEYFGASVVVMPVTETYTAMERGLVDGFAFPADSPFFNFSMQEVTKYYVNPGFGSPIVCFFINLDVWNSIPGDLQKLIMDTVIEAEKEWVTKFYTYHEGILGEMDKAGMTAINLPEDAGNRLQKAWYDCNWKDIIEKSPVYGPKLRALAGT